MTTENFCCICEDKSFEKPYKVIHDFELIGCTKCKVIFLKHYQDNQSNFLNDASSSKNSDVEYWSVPELYKKHQKVFNQFFLQRLNRIKKYQKNSYSNVLDVGAGYGFWSNFLIKNDYNVTSIEPHKQACDYANNTYDINCQNLFFEETDFNQSFDQIFMFDVLEHFINPKQMLEKAKGLLRPGGLIYIQVPNVLGLKYPLNHSLGLPHHIWQFNPKSLRNLLISAGFEPLQYWTGIQGVIGEYENGRVTVFKKSMWTLANFLKRGNRIQFIARAPDA